MTKLAPDARIPSWWFVLGAFAMAASLGAGAALRWLPDGDDSASEGVLERTEASRPLGEASGISPRPLRAAGLGAGSGGENPMDKPAPGLVTLNAQAEASLLARHVEGFFRRPALARDDTFVSSPQPATWNGSCAGEPSTGRFLDLAKQAEKSAGLPLDRYGRDTPSLAIGSLNQFLTDAPGQRFFQLTLASSGEVESRYVIDLFEAADTTLSVEISRTRLAPEEGAAPLARGVAAVQFKALVSDLRDRGFAVLGRGLVVAAAKADGAVVEMSNGRVSRYESGEVRCYAMADAPAQCGCVDGLGSAE